MKLNIDFTAEEEFLVKRLYPLSKGLRNSTHRSIEKIKGIIETGRSAVNDYSKILEENKKRIEVLEPPERERWLGYVNDRLVLLNVATSLPLFRERTLLDLIDEKRPQLQDVMSDSHLMEITFGNLYMSVSLFNSLNVGETPEELAQKLLDIVQVYEQTRALDGRKGQYRSDPPGRAQLAYAFEMLVKKPNVLQRVQESEDYCMLYGKEGLNYEVKDQRFFDMRGRRTIQNVHLQALSKQEPSCFPEPIRILVMDCIPVYDAKKSSIPALYG